MVPGPQTFSLSKKLQCFCFYWRLWDAFVTVMISVNNFVCMWYWTVLPPYPVGVLAHCFHYYQPSSIKNEVVDLATVRKTRRRKQVSPLCTVASVQTSMYCTWYRLHNILLWPFCLRLSRNMLLFLWLEQVLDIDVRVWCTSLFIRALTGMVL